MAPRTKNRSFATLAAVMALTLAGCGTRLTHDAIVQAAGVGGTPGAGPGGYGAPGGTTTGSAGTTSGTAGKTTGAALPGAGSAGGASGAPGAGGSGTTGAAGTGSTGTTGGGADCSKTVILGSVGTYSGPIGSAFKDSPRALQAWAAAINARGGLNCHKVRVVVYDDGGDSGRALSQVRDLVENQKALAMVADQGLAPSVSAWKSYVEGKHFPVIGECGQLGQSSPVIFSPCPTLRAGALATAYLGARYMGKGTKFALLYCAEASDCSFVDKVMFADGGAEKAGLDPVYDASVSVSAPSFTAECLQMGNKGVQLVLVAADGLTVERVARDCKAAGVKVRFVESDVSTTPDMPTFPGLEDVIGNARAFPFVGDTSPLAQEFTSTWARYAGGDAPTGSAGLGWAASKIFETAAKALGQNLTRDALIAQLDTYKNFRFGGITVPLTFTAGKDPTPADCVFTMLGAGGKWTAPDGEKLMCF